MPPHGCDSKSVRECALRVHRADGCKRPFKGSRARRECGLLLLALTRRVLEHQNVAAADAARLLHTDHRILLPEALSLAAVSIASTCQVKEGKAG